MVEPDEHEPVPGRGPAGRALGARLILVVEDQPSIADLAARVLGNAGHRTLTSHSASRALDLARGRRLDALVTDVTLPGMSGPELAAALRLAQPGLPVLFMSGFSRETLGPLGPGDAYLGKPFSPRELVRMVEGLLEPRK